MSDFNYPVRPPLSAHADRLSIMRLTAERDALRKALCDIANYSTADGPYTLMIDRAYEAVAYADSLRGPPDPLDWYHPDDRDDIATIAAREAAYIVSHFGEG